jgi:hypothetical protein
MLYGYPFAATAAAFAAQPGCDPRMMPAVPAEHNMLYAAVHNLPIMQQQQQQFIAVAMSAARPQLAMQHTVQLQPGMLQVPAGSVTANNGMLATQSGQPAGVFWVVQG